MELCGDEQAAKHDSKFARTYNTPQTGGRLPLNHVRRQPTLVCAVELLVPRHHLCICRAWGANATASMPRHA